MYGDHGGWALVQAACQTYHLRQIIQLDIECAALPVGDRLLQGKGHKACVNAAPETSVRLATVQRAHEAISMVTHQSATVFEVSVDLAVLQEVYCCRCTV
jgi:hypothetical protein